MNKDYNWIYSYFNYDYLNTFLVKNIPQRNTHQVNFVLTETGTLAGEHVLDLGCGAGRHIDVFNRLGYLSVGLDINRHYLITAKDSLNLNHKASTLIQGDMRHLPFKARVFQLATLFFTSFGYFSDEDNFAILVEINRVLNRKGYLFLDLENRDHIIKYFKSEEIKEYPELILLEKHRFNIHTGIQSTRRIYLSKGVKKESKRELRLYSYVEVKKMLEKAGFIIDKVYGSYEKDELSLESPRMIIFALNVN